MLLLSCWILSDYKIMLFFIAGDKKKKQDFPVSEQGARLPRDGLKGREMNWEHNVCAFDQ